LVPPTHFVLVVPAVQSVHVADVAHALFAVPTAQVVPEQQPPLHAEYPEPHVPPQVLEALLQA
jgi:hypothetical protein